MDNLVFIENNQAVTDSLTVAEVFSKRHDRVLQDIRDLGCSEEFRFHNFVESSYTNSQNRTLPMYHLNRKGFTLLVMGYTGRDAMKYKEAYIEAFERMEEELKRPKALSEKEQLIAAMKLSIETSEEIAVVKNEMKEVKFMVEQQITLDHGEQRRIQRAVGSKVYELEKNPDIRKRLFMELHRDLKDRFAVTSYKDIKRKDLQAAIRYIDAWVPRRVYA
jgi:Rha family phage regulatory protein